MRRAALLSGIAAGVLAGCGGGPAATLASADFTGTPWAVTLTTRIDCGLGQTGETSTSGQVGFVPSSEEDEIVALSQAGCTLRLHVTGNTAVLVNGPVVCGTTSNGQAFEYSYGSYTATILEGGALTLSAVETENFGGTLCRLEISGTGSR